MKRSKKSSFSLTDPRQQISSGTAVVIAAIIVAIPLLIFWAMQL